MLWLHNLLDRLFGTQQTQSKAFKPDNKQAEDTTEEEIFTATICGHQTQRKGDVVAFGHKTGLQMPINNHGSVDYCLNCIGKMTIQCVLCGEPIFVPEPVALVKRDQNDDIPPHAVLYLEEQQVWIACLGPQCALPALRVGFWMPGDNGKGHIRSVTPPAKMAMQSGKAVIVKDVKSMSEAIMLKEKFNKALH